MICKGQMQQRLTCQALVAVLSFPNLRKYDKLAPAAFGLCFIADGKVAAELAPHIVNKRHMLRHYWP